MKETPQQTLLLVGCRHKYGQFNWAIWNGLLFGGSQQKQKHRAEPVQCMCVSKSVLGEESTPCPF